MILDIRDLSATFKVIENRGGGEGGGGKGGGGIKEKIFLGEKIRRENVEC